MIIIISMNKSVDSLESVSANNEYHQRVCRK